MEELILQYYWYLKVSVVAVVAVYVVFIIASFIRSRLLRGLAKSASTMSLISPCDSILIKIGGTVHNAVVVEKNCAKSMLSVVVNLSGSTKVVWISYASVILSGPRLAS
jgi:hypothetical protein